MAAPARRRAAALETARPGPVPRPALQPVAPAAAAAPPPPAAKSLSREELAAYAQQRKAEREREKEERAVQLRAAKLAAVAQRSGEVASSWNPMAASTASAARPARAGPSRQGNQGAQPAGSSTSSGGSVTGARGVEARRSVGSAAPVELAAAGEPVSEQAGRQPAALAQPPPSLRVEGSSGSLKGASGGWSPRKLPRSQQQQPSSRCGSAAASTAAAAPRVAKPLAQPVGRSGADRQGAAAAAQAPPTSRGPVPALALGRLPGGATTAAAAGQPQSARARPTVAAAAPPVTARPALAAATDPDCGAELDSAEMEARRTQQLVDWGALLVQGTATTAAERVLLGPAAQPEGTPLSAAELPLSYGVRPPADPAGRSRVVQAQVAQALEVLEQQRQLKQALAAAPGASEADRQLLAAEAAADLQAQALLAHWGTQVAVEAREQQRACA